MNRVEHLFLDVGEADREQQSLVQGLQPGRKSDIRKGPLTSHPFCAPPSARFSSGRLLKVAFPTPMHQPTVSHHGSKLALAACFKAL